MCCICICICVSGCHWAKAPIYFPGQSQGSWVLNPGSPDLLFGKDTKFTVELSFSLNKNSTAQEELPGHKVSKVS